MITRGIQEYMSRDWTDARHAKDQYWGQRIADAGPREALRIAEQLRLQALAQCPSWPSPEDRHEDLLSHVRLAELLRRAGPARRA